MNCFECEFCKNRVCSRDRSPYLGRSVDGETKCALMKTRTTPLEKICKNCRWAKAKQEDVYQNGSKLFCGNSAAPVEYYYKDIVNPKQSCAFFEELR